MSTRVAPIFPVSSLVAALAYYRGLGFDVRHWHSGGYGFVAIALFVWMIAYHAAVTSEGLHANSVARLLAPGRARLTVTQSASGNHKTQDQPPPRRDSHPA